MTSSDLPENFVQREHAEPEVGKSSKTMFRHIKEAIEAPKKKHEGMLEHCCVQLLDGDVIMGTDVDSVNEIDQYRREGKVPTWYVDPVFFRRYFSKKKKPGDTTEPAAAQQPVLPGKETGTSGHEVTATTRVDSHIIEQYEARLREKDERIAELKEDKKDLQADKRELNQQLRSNTNLTERITGLLSHSQLAALGVPRSAESQKGVTESEPSATAPLKPDVIDVPQPEEIEDAELVGNDSPEEEPEKVRSNSRPAKSPESQSPVRKSASGKSGTPGKATGKKRSKGSGKKETKWYNRDVRSFFRRKS